MTLVKDHMENVLGSIEQESLKMSLNALTKENIGKPEFKSDWQQHLAIQEMFQVHKNAYNFIDDIVFYEGLSGVVLTNNYGYVLMEDYKDRNDIKAALDLEIPAAWTYLPEAQEVGYISYIRRIPYLSTEKPQGLLIIQVKEKMLSKHMMTYSSYFKNQSLFVLDSRDHIIVQSASSVDSLPSLTEKTIGLDKVLASDESSGHYKIRASNGVSYIGVFQRTLLGRTYISLLPENEWLHQVAWIRWVTVFAVLVLLLFGMLLTFISSKLVYNPIENLIKYGEKLQGERTLKPKGNEIEFIKSCLDYLNKQALALESYVQKTEPSLRDQLLKRLLKSSAGKGSSLAEECAAYQLDTKGSFIVLITRVENLFNEKRFLPSEGAIVLFAIMNVIKELLSKSPMDGFVVEDYERESITILHFNEQMAAERILEMTRILAEEIQDAMSEYLSFSVSSGIGGIYSTITQLSSSYREAQKALQYRVFSDSQAILFFDDMENSPAQSSFSYPREYEKLIIQSLSRGEMAYAETALEQFAQKVKISESYNTIYQCYYVLLSSIIQSLEEEGPGVIDALEGNWFDQLKARQTAREIYEWFIDTVFPRYQNMTVEFQKKSVKIAIQKVCIHIREHSETNYSLIECADIIGMSPSYLSRMFKKEMGVTFIEYMTEYKVEKAKQSLQDTDLSVTEIANIVGYSERNLNRNFQRYVGMSPRQYRMSHR